jgi:ABC-type uncharacterized transport system ATPase subunit
MSTSQPALVEVLEVSKRFGAVRALDAVSLTVRPGSFHAIIGENGAGKSTVAKCMLGVYSPDAGEVRVDGVRISGPAQARGLGVGMVFQQFKLIPSLTVAENLILAREDLPAFPQWRELRAGLRRFLQTSPFTVDLDAKVAHLAAGQKQKVEILKQLYLETKILILDEPTSVLTPAESEEVMTAVSALVKKGSLSVVLISHRFPEVMNFADEVTVMRGGRVVISLPVKQTNPAQLAEYMMGQSRPPQPLTKTSFPAGRPALEIDRLVVKGDTGLVAVDRVNLSVSPGEILGVAGVSGNGQRELVQAIAGQRSIESGSIRAFGEAFHPNRSSIRKTKLFTIPEEPLQNATVPAMSVAENLALRRFDQPPVARGRWFLHRGAMRDAALTVIQAFSIRPPDPEVSARSLSGGNLQKAVMGRDLMAGDAAILVVANPCMGLDFLATASLHNRLVEMRNRGGALLVVSEDLDELVELADRIVVMSGGRIAYETHSSKLDRTVIGSHFGGHT